MKNFSATSIEAPVIFWVSTPVRPGETVMLAGHALEAARMAVAPLPHGAPGVPMATEGSPSTTSSNLDWTEVEPLRGEPATLSATLPATLPPGLLALRVAHAAGEATVILNEPDVWWMQGDAGAAATSGGWLRLHGRCLGMAEDACIALRRAEDASWRVLPGREKSCWALIVDLPTDLEPGRYEVRVHNGWGGATGWRPAGVIEVKPCPAERRPVLDVTAYGAVPNSDKDCTLPIVRALERLQALGGGVLYFPRGRYRIDAGLRSGMWIAHSLRLPPNVTLRGESMETTSLYWPDRAEPLPTLIEADDDFTVEEITFYCQGRHRNVISGRGNAVIRRVRIRANAYLHLDTPGRPGRGGRNVSEPHINMGTAIELEGDNVRITECDILHSAMAIKLKNTHGAYVAHNLIRHGQCYFMSYGGERVVFEHNRCEGAHLCATGASVALFFGATTSRHHYLAHNHLAHLYGGDRETLTFDGHGTAYAGGVAATEGQRLTLAGEPTFGLGGRDAMPDPYDLTVYILSGRGAGQYRRVIRAAGRELEIDRPWDVAPDASSVVGVGAFIGRHLLIGNAVEDSGALIQLYPPNTECVVAENTGRRVYPIKVWGKFGMNVETAQRRVEPSWFNQVLHNRIAEGNAWGNSEGGVLIWGEQVRYRVNERHEDMEQPLERADLARMLSRPLEQTEAPAIVRWTVVRDTTLASNAAIRVRGAVRDVLIENTSVANSDHGVIVERGPEAATSADRDFGQPQGILVRNLQCHNVRESLGGSGAGVVTSQERTPSS